MPQLWNWRSTARFVAILGVGDCMVAVFFLMFFFLKHFDNPASPKFHTIPHANGMTLQFAYFYSHVSTICDSERIMYIFMPSEWAGQKIRWCLFFLSLAGYACFEKDPKEMKVVWSAGLAHSWAIISCTKFHQMNRGDQKCCYAANLHLHPPKLAMEPEKGPNWKRKPHLYQTINFLVSIFVVGVVFLRLGKFDVSRLTWCFTISTQW